MSEHVPGACPSGTVAFVPSASSPDGLDQRLQSTGGFAAACLALCQSGKFETGQGGCAAICMSMLGSSRGGPHGCSYAARVHGKLANSILEAIAKAEGR